MRSTLLTSIVLLAASACGRTELDTRTFALHHLDEVQAAEVVEPYVFTDRPNAPGRSSYGPNLLTVRETPDNLAKIERVLAEVDRPRPTLQLRFQLIEADGAGDADLRIADVAAELSRLFRFEGYRLLDETIVSATAGAEVTNLLGRRFQLNVDVERVTGGVDAGSVRLLVGLTSLTSGEVFRTTVTIPAGTTAVLGNVRAGEAGNALILTVRAEFLGQAG